MSFVFYLMLALFSSPNVDGIILPGEPNDDGIIMQDDSINKDDIILPGEPNDDRRG